MSTDYLDAANRHRADAELLFGQERWPNADQLYGLAAECGLKAIMQALGMTVRSDGAPDDKRHRVHIDKLWGEFQSFAQGHRGASYAAMLPSKNPFIDWKVDQRYHHTASILATAVDDHKKGADHVCQALHLAQQDGRL